MSNYSSDIDESTHGSIVASDYNDYNEYLDDDFYENDDEYPYENDDEYPYENDDEYLIPPLFFEKTPFKVPISPAFQAITDLNEKFYQPLFKTKIVPSLEDIYTKSMMSHHGTMFMLISNEQRRLIYDALTDKEAKILLFYRQISFHNDFVGKNVDENTHAYDIYEVNGFSDDFYDPCYRNDDTIYYNDFNEYDGPYEQESQYMHTYYSLYYYGFYNLVKSKPSAMRFHLLNGLIL